MTALFLTLNQARGGEFKVFLLSFYIYAMGVKLKNENQNE